MRSTRRPPKNPLDHEPTAVTYAREKAGLTRIQLAEQCGVVKSLITEIENGTRNATPAMIDKLAEALNCPRVILERKREPETAPPAAVDLLEPEVRSGERADAEQVLEVRH